MPGFLVLAGVAGRAGLTARTSRWRTRKTKARMKAEVTRALPWLLAGAPELRHVRTGDWLVLEMHATVSDMIVATVGPPGLVGAAVVKLANTRAAAQTLRRQSTVLPGLLDDPRLGDWCQLLPAVLGQGQLANYAYCLESCLPGRDGNSLISDRLARETMTAAAAAAIGELHRRTSRRVVLDSHAVTELVDEPLQVVDRLYLERHGTGTGMGTRSGRRAVHVLRQQLRAELTGRAVDVSWIHGDYSLGNVLFADQGRTVTGIVDWSGAHAQGLAPLDVLHLLLSTRALATGRELGVEVRDLLDRGRWSASERAVLAHAHGHSSGEPISPQALLLISWLTHVATNLAKSDRYARHRLWRYANIDVVLAAVDRAGRSAATQINS
jgi:hypothetical protein